MAGPLWPGRIADLCPKCSNANSRRPNAQMRDQTMKFRSSTAQFLFGKIKSDLRQPWPRSHKIYRYAMAVLSVGVAVFATEFAARLLYAEPTALLLLCAVIFAAWFGGFGPALLAITLGLFSFYYDIAPPADSSAWKHDLLAVDIYEVPRLVLFFITSLIVGLIVAAERKSTEALRRSREKLQRAFDEIKRSEDRLRLVTDTIPTLVWRAGPDGNPDFLNQPALDYTGLSPDQAELGWPRAFHPDDKKAMLVRWSAIRESGMPGGLEARLRRFDGEYRWFWFQAQPLRDESGSIVKWYGSATDIEDRKRTEQALRESEQRFRDYAETASDWLWETGPDHQVSSISEHVNAAGLVPSLLPGVTRWDIATDAESEPEKWRLHRETLDAHRPFRDFVYSTVKQDGSQVFVRSSGKPLFDVNGGFLGYRGTGTDITATIRVDQAEQALREAQAELAHVTRVTTLGELTASIAHEVNQPLAAAVANAEAALQWLDREIPNIVAARRSVEWVISDSYRASEVVQRVRALAKKKNIERAPLDLNQIAREAIALVQRELASHRVSLRTELASALPKILGDRIQLQQVIINLLINGIEAMQLVTDRQRELVVRSGQDETHRILLSVTDAGVGIAAENANQLFSAFFTTKSSGLGMGLSISRSIVEAHGGHLSAFGNEGPGATFKIVLPMHQEDAP